MQLTRFVLTFCAVCAIFFNVKGQIIEKVVALSPIYYSEHTADKDYSERIYHYVLNTLQNTQRLSVLDRIYGQNLISVEKKLNQGVDFVEGKVVDQGKQNGAEFILFIYVNSLQTYEIQREKTDKDTKAKNIERVGYDCDLSLFARVINVETGQVIASQIISPSGNASLGDVSYSSKATNKVVGALVANLTQTPQSPQDAIKKRIGELEPYIRKFIDEVFPLELKISDIQLVPKDQTKPDGKKMPAVFIVGGKSTGFKENDNLVVKEIVSVTIAGKRYNDDVPIGKIKVLRAGSDLVTCKIVEGEEIIQSKFKEDNKKLKVVFIPVKKLF